MIDMSDNQCNLESEYSLYDRFYCYFYYGKQNLLSFSLL